MSRTLKKVLYYLFFTLFAFAAAAGTVWIMYSAAFMAEDWQLTELVWICLIAIIMEFLIPLPILVHEGGHVLGGLLCKMKFVTFQVGNFLISKRNVKIFVRYQRQSSAGRSEFFPKNGGNMRARLLVTTLAAGIFNLIYGGGFLALWFLQFRHPALLFFELFAPLSLLDGIDALFPFRRRVGKTDGAVALGLIRHAPEEEIMLRVLEAQGVLYRGEFSDVPRELLFQVPVVREDLPAYHALLFLRMQYMLAQNDIIGAQKEFDRLRILEEYFSEEEKEDLLRYGTVFDKEVFQAKKQLLFGVNILEEKLQGDSWT